MTRTQRYSLFDSYVHFVNASHSSSDVLVKQLKQDIALISRLPAELQMRSTRAQMLELVQWTRQATRSGSDQVCVWG